jgi:hypothetical protein
MGDIVKREVGVDFNLVFFERVSSLASSRKLILYP